MIELMNAFLRGLWDEFRHEPGLCDSPGSARLNLAFAVAIVVAWVGSVAGRPQLPRDVVPAACAGAACLLFSWLGWRHVRLTRAESGMVVAAIGMAGLVAALTNVLSGWVVGMECVAISIAHSARLGFFGLGLAVVLGGAGLAVFATHQPGALPILLMLAAEVCMFIGPLFGLRSRRMLREQAASAERERLAREVHDVLAHTLSALSVQIEGARMLLQERPGDPRALENMNRARRLVAAGLAETAQAVAALRGDVPAGPDALRRLADDFAAETGVACRFELEGDPVPLAADAGLALYRAAQEALANIRKHAHATEVTVRLRYRDRRAELTIDDVGASKPALASSGYGLTGIRERTELLGGELDAGPTPDGFHVRLSVPA